jgi:hypothetical protein
MAAAPGSRPDRGHQPHANLDGRRVAWTSWPNGTHPRESSVFAHNEIVLSAAPWRVWEWLVDAGYWSKWYFNADDVRIGSGGEILQPGSFFTWITFGVPITSRVDVYDPPHAIGWQWWRRGARGYHGWLIKQVDSGSRVITEESQQGFLPSTLGFLIQPALSWAHGHWLRKLALESKLGPPPDA